MKRAIGIDFTEHTVRVLREKGFSPVELPRDEAKGYRGYLFPLADSEGGADGFEIHVIVDEEAYLKWTGHEHFFPYFRSDASVASARDPKFEHANKAAVLLGPADLRALGNEELREALELRKQFPLQALHLACRDLEHFVETAHPLHIYSTRGGDVALIHLGPSCFDLLVSERA